MTSEVQSLEQRIEEVKRALVELGDLRPGSLSTQYNVCGSPGCQCKDTPPKKHGPYYQISYTRKGKHSTRFVPSQDLPGVRQQLKNYARMRDLIDRWIDLATKLSDLRLPHRRRRSPS